MNLPNKLTMLRMLLIPVFVACFYVPGKWARLIAAVVFLGAFITDIYDGRIARRNNLVTNFGKLMDPIADKLLTSAAFIMLVSDGSLSPIVTIVVVAREFLISGYRLVAIEAGTVIAASKWGKLKTVSQCVAVIALLIWPYFNVKFPLDQVLVWLCAALTVFSGADYIFKNRNAVRLK
ncbi:CDP-diacylglycerol--glycerol-3-phosphate 3-phosphatidyltransferase [Christensenellaceae bacterium OttesenSCG-928-L17]|nr:CDP-diacylglycerol--glycerol-3-phosphate 3-phosphatidyltransferase [Christensenellaceae bacterium OttesenSCG-928-L17]